MLCHYKVYVRKRTNDGYGSRRGQRSGGGLTAMAGVTIANHVSLGCFVLDLMCMAVSRVVSVHKIAAWKHKECASWPSE
jgi:hypothetical protein